MESFATITNAKAIKARIQMNLSTCCYPPSHGKVTNSAHVAGYTYLVQQQHNSPFVTVFRWINDTSKKFKKNDKFLQMNFQHTSLSTFFNLSFTDFLNNIQNSFCLI